LNWGDFLWCTWYNLTMKLQWQTTAFRRQLKTFGSSLPMNTGIQTDDCFVMCPWSSSRGHNTSTAVTVQQYFKNMMTYCPPVKLYCTPPHDRWAFWCGEYRLTWVIDIDNVSYKSFLLYTLFTSQLNCRFLCYPVYVLVNLKRMFLCQNVIQSLHIDTVYLKLLNCLYHQCWLFRCMVLCSECNNISMHC